MTAGRPTDTAAPGSATARGVGRLLELGQSPWYDNLTRPLARGGLTSLVNDQSIRGVTSNPTIFEKAITGSDAYDTDIAALAEGGNTAERIYWDLVTDDIAHAADRLRATYDDSAHIDGYVSIEVDPRLARDSANTLAQAQELYARLGRPNVMIKIPATLEGLPAITECIAAGINVNVTLIFSLDRYAAVLAAHAAGLQARVDRDQPIADIASVASFFVSRVDTETDPRLPAAHGARGRVAVANAKLAYQGFLEHVATPAWSTLATAGAQVQRPLWASTSTKNPAYSPTLYVDELVGPNSVNTLADASVDALEAAGTTPLTPDAITHDVAEARNVFAAISDAGVDFDDVTATLEHDGVASFAASFDAAVDAISAKMAALSA